MTWQSNGEKDIVTYEADPRHAEIFINEMGVEVAKPSTSPALKSEVEDDEDENEFSDAQTTAFRSTVARANYLALDRPDIHLACKEVCPAMSHPCEWHWVMLRKLAIHFDGKPRLVHRWWGTKRVNTIRAFIDANWVGDTRDRTSTPGGLASIGLNRAATRRVL